MADTTLPLERSEQLKRLRMLLKQEKRTPHVGLSEVCDEARALKDNELRQLERAGDRLAGRWVRSARLVYQTRDATWSQSRKSGQLSHSNITCAHFLAQPFRERHSLSLLQETFPVGNLDECNLRDVTFVTVSGRRLPVS